MDQSLLESLRVVALPTKTNFRGISVREVALFMGEYGWGEFSPHRGGVLQGLRPGAAPGHGDRPAPRRCGAEQQGSAGAGGSLSPVGEPPAALTLRYAMIRVRACRCPDDRCSRCCPGLRPR